MTYIKLLKKLSIVRYGYKILFAAERNLFSFLLVPIMVFIRFLIKIFKKSLRLRTYVGGSDFLCIIFIFLVLSNTIGEKMIWVLLLIHRFISDRRQYKALISNGQKWFKMRTSAYEIFIVSFVIISKFFQSPSRFSVGFLARWWCTFIWCINESFHAIWRISK